MLCVVVVNVRTRQGSMSQFDDDPYIFFLYFHPRPSPMVSSLVHASRLAKPLSKLFSRYDAVTTLRFFN